MTEGRLVARLRSEAERTSVAAVAARLGFSAPYMSRVVRGELGISASVALAMGYQRVTVYRRLSSGERAA